MLSEYVVNTLAFIGGAGLLGGAIIWYSMWSDTRSDAKRAAESDALTAKWNATRTRELAERIATKLGA